MFFLTCRMNLKLIVTILDLLALTCISFAINLPNGSLENTHERSSSRQLGFIANPFRRAANTTRNVVKFIREYSTARLTNGTTPKPETAVGVRATAILQHVTLNNIRHAVTTLLQSDAAPVVGNILTNLDRDTLQLFTSPERTPPSIIARFTKSTTVKPRQVVNSTSEGNATMSTTELPTVTIGSTKISIKSALAPPTDGNYKKGDEKIVVSEGDEGDDEDESNEDDN